MTTTTTVACLGGQWTQVASGSANVLLQGPPYDFRVAIGASAPADITGGPICDDAGGNFSLNSLADGDKVFVAPAHGVPVTVYVIAS